MKNILIADSIDKECIDKLESEGYRVDYSPGISFGDLKEKIKNCNALIVRSSTRVTSEIINEMEKMEVIGRAGTGVDNIDVDAATRKGIIVMNTPGGNTISAAEHTIALLLSMCRNISQSNQSLRRGEWDRKKHKGTELYDKTIGIIGLGKIGSEVAKRCKAFEMNVLGYDPIVSESVLEKTGIQKVDIDNLLNKSDFITVHVPLNKNTENLISSESLKKCKDGVKIINCARGGIVNEDDIIEAVKNGKVSSAAFDVYSEEPPDLKSELFQNEKILTTPHLGASTEEAQKKVAVQIADQIIDLFKNKSLTGVVNASALKEISNKKLLPYLNLAENIGAIHSQMISGNLKSITVKCSGNILTDSLSIISTAVLKGFLSKSMSEFVNLVNAPSIAKEKEISINEVKTNPGNNYSNLIKVEIESDRIHRSLSGTVFENSEQRIVNIDGFHIEFKPEGNLLFYKNVDRPGVVASVSNLLAEGNINIAGLSLGRYKKKENAVTVIVTDNIINPELKNKISRINGINEVYTVTI